MEEKDLDLILRDLVELTRAYVTQAKTLNVFNKEIAESSCIVLSMAYGRWGNGNQSANRAAHKG